MHPLTHSPSTIRLAFRLTMQALPPVLVASALASCGGTDSSHAAPADAGDAGAVVEPEPAAMPGDPVEPTREAGINPPPLEDAGSPPEPDGGGVAVTPEDAGTPSSADAAVVDAAVVDAGGGFADTGPSPDGGLVGSAEAGVSDAGQAAPAEAGPPPLLETVDEFVIGGSQCGLAFSSQTGRLWLYPCSGEELLAYDEDGAPLLALARPGESANDVDIDVAPLDFALAGVTVPAGSLLFVNGETGVAEIYALDPETGTVLATLTTGFGAGHVVGAAHHPSLDTLFAIQDRVPGSPDGNVVAALDPETGTVTSSWSTLPNFDVNYGDVEVCPATGNLMLVSSEESDIAEFTPDGTFVLAHPLPSGVGGLSGISLDDASGRVWVASNSGGVWNFTGGPCAQVAD